MAKVTTDGIQQLRIEQDKRIANLQDKSVYLRQVGELLLGNRKKRFDDEAGPGGVAWEPLADSTVTAFLRPVGMRGRQSRETQRAIKRSGERKTGREVSRTMRELNKSRTNVRQQQGILRELGKALGITTRQATKTTGDRRGAGNILDVSGTLKSLQLRIEGDKAIIGNPPAAEKYAATHQFGDPSRGIPARPYMGFDDKDLADIEDLREFFLDRAYDGDRN